MHLVNTLDGSGFVSYQAIAGLLCDVTLETKQALQIAPAPEVQPPTSGSAQEAVIV